MNLFLYFILSFGDRFNILVDDIISAAWRLMELPLFIILSILLILYFGIQFIVKKRRLTQIATLILFLFAFAFIADHKITNALIEIRSSNAERNFSSKNSFPEEYLSEENILVTISEIMSVDEWKENIKTKAINKGISFEQCIRENAIYVLEEEHKKKIKNRKIIQANSFTIEEKLKQSFGDVLFNQKTLHESVIYSHIRINQPKQDLHVVKIDLLDTLIKINVTPQLKGKYLTSKFARNSRSFLAINGEAGNSAQLGAPFGPWIGNWVSEGRAVMLKDNRERPFMCFDKNNKAMYFPEKIADTILNSQKFNCIYGRFDILLNGTNLEQEPKYRQPRTLMGLNSTGDKLILMVVDGRRPSHSIGMGLYRAAHIMQIFGAHNAMSCDQGGSSCMYIESEGIVNIPADDGRERPTYSHFGIGLR